MNQTLCHVTSLCSHDVMATWSPSCPVIHHYSVVCVTCEPMRTEQEETDQTCVLKVSFILFPDTHSTTWTRGCMRRIQQESYRSGWAKQFSGITNRTCNSEISKTHFYKLLMSAAAAATLTSAFLNNSLLLFVSLFKWENKTLHQRESKLHVWRRQRKKPLRL